MEQENNIPVNHVAAHKLGVVDSDEVLCCVIKRHYFGLFYMYLLSAIGLMGAIGLVGLSFNLLNVKLSTSQLAIVVAVVGILLFVVLLLLLLATFVYRQSKLIVTDKNITQVMQKGLFNRKISQLSMANVEDVTAEQKGIFALTFGYGVLKIETAGEQANFVFDFCPNPNKVAKDVLDARERFIEFDPRRAERANHRLHM